MPPSSSTWSTLLWPAVLGPIVVYVWVLVLHILVPARTVRGYVCGPDGERLSYRLNGLVVFLLTVLAWAGACATGLLRWDAFYVHRHVFLGSACAIGLLFTAVLVLPAPPRRGLLADLYLGRLENPQLPLRGGGVVDAKMYLYLVGAVLLALNLYSFAAFHYQAHAGDPSPGVAVHVGLFSFFLCEYLFFEEVHLYTYDFMAERVGFKLGWGCLVFYPFFYAIGLWTTADLPNPHVSPALLVVSALLFFSGWGLSRGANLQKFQFKRNPLAKAFGWMDPRAISANGRHVLTGGFWGLSRHINYLGEILMATGLALSLGHPTVIGPWLYPLYYVALLLPRQADDDRRCAERYGPLWDEYRKRVPWRIIPGIY